MSRPSAGNVRRDRSERDFGWAVYIVGLLCIKVTVFVMDPIPKFFFGDSAWYIGTAFTDLMPMDRSFTYGYLIKLLTLGSKSFTLLIASQVLASTASAILLAYALKKYFSINSAVAYVLGIVCAIEPIQMLYEREVMTEAFSLFCFALYMVSAFEYLSSRKLKTLCLVQLLGAALISLRLSFLPIISVNTAVLPVLASFARFRKKDPDAHVNGSGASAGPGILHFPGVHLLIAVCLATILHTGYTQIFSKLSGYPPGYGAASGYFLVSIWAPCIEPVDFPYPELRTAVFGNLIYDRKDRFKRNQQLFASGGLVNTICRAVPGPAGNQAATKTAINALKRDPMAIAMLSFRTFGDYFNIEVLREEIINDLAMDDDEIQLYRECQETFGQYARFPDQVGGLQAMTLTKSYYKAAVPWYWFLIFAPILCTLAFFRTKDPLTRIMMIEISLATFICVAIACFITVFPVVRYLHPVSWMVIFPLACLLSREKGGERC